MLNATPPSSSASPAVPVRRGLRGRVLNPLSDTACAHYADGVLIWEEPPGGGSRILACGEAAELIAAYDLPPAAVEPFAGVLLPGFFDLHFHWVQDSVRLMPKDTLLEWLRRYTFPAEARFADPAYAEATAGDFWPRILATGTIGGCCYSSIHETALEAAVAHSGEHFRIGNVLMTMHSSPALTQPVRAAISLVEAAAARHRDRYVASPRFAPTTGPAVMRAAGAAARAHGSFIQTHLAETHAEIAWVTEMYRDFPGFEDIASYTEIYDRVGLLGPRTIMGHCLHLSSAEWRRLAETDTVIASCPTSNAPHEEHGLESGLFDFHRADAHGVRWGLATDIGGGPFLSMLDVMRSFVAQNERAGVDGATRVRALYRSTLASAEILEKGARMGNFLPGKELSYVELPAVAAAPETSAEDVLAALLEPYRDDREAAERCVRRTVINGQTVFSAS